MKPFRLLHLPFLGKKRVLNIMEISEIIRLALCSKKTRLVIKKLNKTVSFKSLSDNDKENMNVLDMIDLLRLEIESNHRLEFESNYRLFLEEQYISVDVSVSDNIGFSFKVPCEQECMRFEVCANSKEERSEFKGIEGNIKIGEIEAPIIMTKSNELHTFWDNKHDGFQIIADGLQKVFKRRIKSIRIKGGTKQNYSEGLKFSINWITSKVKTIESFEVREEGDGIISDEDFKFILNDKHPKYSLQLSGEKHWQFQNRQEINSDFFNLENAKYFTIDNLLMTNCKIIGLGNSDLTNSDLKEYMKWWLAGKFPNLESLVVHMKEIININTILSGLPGYSQRRKHTLTEFSLIRTKHKISVKRPDGVIAQIGKFNQPINDFEMWIRKKQPI